MREHAFKYLCSIAPNPYRPAQEKEATINFASVPSSLSSHVGKDKWQFPLLRSKLHHVFSEDDDDDAFYKVAEFDTYFRGFTSLCFFQNASDHKIEYLTILQNHRAVSDSCSCIAISGLGGHAFDSFKEREEYHM